MKKYFIAISQLIIPFIYNFFKWILPWSRHPEKVCLNKRFYYAQKFIKKVTKTFNVTYDAKTYFDFLNHRDFDKNYLFVCNHLSLYDPLILICLSDKPITFAAKIQSLKQPFVGRIIKVLGGVFLDRDDLKQQVQQIMYIEKQLKNTKHLDWCIFPEGTRNKMPEGPTLDYKYGTFKTAIKSNVPIEVLTSFGTFRILDSKSNRKYFPISIEHIREILPEEYHEKTTVEIASEVQKQTNEVLVEIRERNNSLYDSLNKN